MFPFRLNFPDNSPSKYDVTENGYVCVPFIGSTRNRHKLMMLLLKMSFVLIIILALIGSFWWTISISPSSRGHIFHGYRRLQVQLFSYLWDIGEISFGSSRLQDVEFCPCKFENYVPCYNVSENLASGLADGQEYSWNCEHGMRQYCLVLPPVNFKIPLRWPTGRDVIWVANVKFTAQEVLLSGSLTKRLVGFHLFVIEQSSLAELTFIIYIFLSIKTEITTLIFISCN